MSKDRSVHANTGTARPAKISPAAERALREAEERRRNAQQELRPHEVGGREGPDPVRYGDWEKDGRCIDF